MSSAQRSVFTLTATQDGAGVVTPSAARELAKGAELLGVQLVTSFTTFDAPATILATLQGRNGDTDDDWVAILQASSSVIDSTGNFNQALGGGDALIPVAQFTEVRLTFAQLAGVPADLTDLSLTAHCKTDYLTG